MKREPFGRFLPDARELTEFIDGLLDLGREEGHKRSMQEKGARLKRS